MVIWEVNAYFFDNLACFNLSVITEHKLLESKFKLCLQQYLLGLDIALFFNYEFAFLLREESIRRSCFRFV